MSLPLEEFDPEAQMVAKQLRANPDWVLYPTDDFFEAEERYVGPYIGIWKNLYGFNRQPRTVKQSVDRLIDNRIGYYDSIDPSSPTSVRLARDTHEGFWPETELASSIVSGLYTLDPREAAMHIRDKYTGPKE